MCYTNKTNLFCKHCIVALPILAAISLSSCNDQDFDWDKAHGQNLETNYEQRFDKLFGDIDPNQSWDFSDGVVTKAPESFTLEDGTEIVALSRDINVQGTRSNGDYSYTAVQTKTDWFAIPSTTIQWFKNTLVEGGGDDGNGHLGHPFVMYVPGTAFSITPMYQGGHGMKWELRLTFFDPDGHQETVAIWTNGQKLRYKNSSTGSWKYPANNVTDWPNTTSAVEIEGQTMHFQNVPRGTKIEFNLHIVLGASGYATTGTDQTSTNHMMLALDVPADKCPTTMPIDYGEHNRMMIMGCEDANLRSSDWDYNDVVFLVNGLVPRTIENRIVSETISKRYMVEDMGYAETAAAVPNYTDIDFNDIVIDFTKTVRKKYYRSQYEGEEYENVPELTETLSTSSSATVRALGGTWDFQLQIGGTKVFQKRTAMADLNVDTRYGVSNILPGIMYNTGRGTDQNGDGKFDFNIPIGTLKANVDNWDPDNDNISFIIIDDTADPTWNVDQYFDSDNEKPGNVYNITFPKVGAHPKIAAFPLDKEWKRERVAVDQSFFSTTKENWSSTTEQDWSE